MNGKLSWFILSRKTKDDTTNQKYLSSLRHLYRDATVMVMIKMASVGSLQETDTFSSGFLDEEKKHLSRQCSEIREEMEFGYSLRFLILTRE